MLKKVKKKKITVKKEKIVEEKSKNVGKRNELNKTIQKKEEFIRKQEPNDDVVKITEIVNE